MATTNSKEHTVSVKGNEVPTAKLASALINSSPTAKRMGIPTVNGDASNLAEISSMLNRYPAAQNEIQSALVNRIVFTILETAEGTQIQNIFEKGWVDTGFTIQEIYNDLIMDNRKQYKAQSTPSELLKMYPANTQAAYHEINIREYLPLTVPEMTIAAAFASLQSLENYIDSIVSIMKQTFEQIMYEKFKEMLSAAITGGFMDFVLCKDVKDKPTAETLTVEERAKALEMGITSTKHNIAGVYNRDNMDDLYLLTKPRTTSYQDVMSLASAFNMDRAEFYGHVVNVDDFGEGVDDSVLAVLVSKKFFNIFTQRFQMLTFQSPADGNMQYFLHYWKCMYVSPFAQGCCFCSKPATVSGVTVTPATPTLSKGSTFWFSADVEGTGYPFAQVKWTIEGNTDPDTQIKNGILYIGMNEGESFTVKATSTFNPEVNGTTLVTVR